MQSKLPIVAIVGQTNVGKSSLFNAFLKRREAIVAKEPGTTRDPVTEVITYKNSSFWLVDTAGLKEAEDEFEESIQDQVTQAIETADVILMVIDASTVTSNNERQLAKQILKSRKPILLVVNKIDQMSKATEDNFRNLGVKDILLTSVPQRRGIEEALDQIRLCIPQTRYVHDVDRIKLAIIGRPNVGKSRLFNTMLVKQEAIVSDRAGTTRDVNRKALRFENRTIEIMDTAGIRRSGKIEKGIEHFSVLRTLAGIQEADICVLVMDVNELNVTLDQKIAGMVKDADKGLILVISKWDSLEDRTMHDSIIANIRRTYDFVPWASLVITSAVSGQNVTKLFNLAIEIMEERKKKIKTPVLNRWLESTVAKHPPAGLKNFTPKLNYIVQETDNPSPTFKVFGRHTRLLHWSYKRFMEHEMRNKFGFEGTAIRFWFFDKSPKSSE